MSIVIADMTMSLDGFIADPDDRCDELFGWYFNGPVAVPPFAVSENSARHLRSGFEHLGALVCGRRLFDLTGGWNGAHPMGVPVVVVSHRPAPFSFVDGVSRAAAVPFVDVPFSSADAPFSSAEGPFSSVDAPFSSVDAPFPSGAAPFSFVDGVSRAVAAARELAGPAKWVGVASASIARQCLELGLLDEIRVALAPVLLGRGITWFTGVSARLSDPEIIPGTGVTHLYYKVLK
ncbi:dihydrofolate reductase family protein [Dactylosporangium sp. CS-047395]|uniref:dihydrofolate reductase family protein n=1 Tax=Dactylosporangium sp. CS-047395 TaxID=3239936 RepID=UPI003D9472F7